MQCRSRIVGPRTVPAVSADQMGIAFPLVEHWLERQEHTSDPFDAPEIFAILSRVKQKLDVEPTMAVALFKRSLALLLFCAEVALPKSAFNGRCPGRELLLAASKTTVFDIPGEDGGHSTSHFDTLDLLQAFRSAMN